MYLAPQPGFRQPLRIGANPWRAPLREPENARRRNPLTRVGKIAGNSSEPEKSRGLTQDCLPPGRGDGIITVKSPGPHNLAALQMPRCEERRFDARARADVGPE
jgi:hypothetical protein